MKNKREISRLKRHKRIRLKIYGTAERPRLVVKRSINNLYAQLVDDISSKVLFSVSTNDKEAKQKIPAGGNVKSADSFGEFASKKLKEKGINKIVFDRCGYLYHGRIKAFAEALRKGGVEF